MTNEELAVEIQSGRTELIPALWQNIERFTRRQANNWLSIREASYPEYDDFYNTGYIALIEALKTYNPRCGKTFIGWYALYLKTAFYALSGLRTTKRDALDICDSLDAPISDDGIELWETVADSYNCYEDAERAIWNKQLHEAIECALNGLTSAEADIIRRSYYNGDTLQIIANDLGVAVQTVYAKKQRGLREMWRKNRKELEQFIEDQTPYYSGTGLSSFKRTGASAVENAVVKRDKLRCEFFP